MGLTSPMVTYSNIPGHRAGKSGSEPRPIYIQSFSIRNPVLHESYLESWVGLNRQREGNHKQGYVCSKMMSKDPPSWWGFEPTSLEGGKPAWSRGRVRSFGLPVRWRPEPLDFARADVFPVLSSGPLPPILRII